MKIKKATGIPKCKNCGTMLTFEREMDKKTGRTVATRSGPGINDWSDEPDYEEIELYRCPKCHELYEVRQDQ